MFVAFGVVCFLHTQFLESLYKAIHDMFQFLESLYKAIHDMLH